MDLTDRMLAFRECARSIWNDHLRSLARKEYLSHDVFRFRQIEALLFQTMICDRIGHVEHLRDRVEDYDVRIIVKIASGAHLPLMIQRDRDSVGYWDHEVKNSEGCPITGRFLSFFDWDESGFVDFQYAKMLIEEFAAASDVVGLQALVQVQAVRFEFQDSS